LVRNVVHKLCTLISSSCSHILLVKYKLCILNVDVSHFVGPKGDSGLSGSVGPKGEASRISATGLKGQQGKPGLPGLRGVSGTNGNYSQIKYSNPNLEYSHSFNIKSRIIVWKLNEYKQVNVLL